MDRYDTQDGLYDVAWSEIHENQIVTASGDGTLRLWDVTLQVSSTLSHPALPSNIQVNESNTGLSDTCVARAYPRSFLCRLVQHQQGVLRIWIMGRKC